MRLPTLIAVVLACAPSVARAQPGASDEVRPAQPDEPLPTPEELAERIEELETKQRATESALRRASATHDQVQTLVPLRRFITVFVDIGAFAVAGDGAGIRSDLDHVYFPQYTDRIAGQWVFMGDPLSTAINSLGEPADTSNSREIQTDTIKSDGRPSAIVNAIGLSIGKEVGHGVALAAFAQLLPRPGPDLVVIELAQVDYRPSQDLDLVISAGKVDSVLGIEYRAQDAPRRLGVTPSLICRYTCGRPIGIRARLVRGRLDASAAITNGDSFVDRFAPDVALKLNSLPTVSGHLQWMLPLGQGLELGVSGALGPQDGQSDSSVAQWHFGFDARLRDIAQFDFTAEYVQGLQQGWTTNMAACNAAACLTYKGAYLRIDRRMNSWFTPYVRFDWRDAVHKSGVDFVYESHTLRGTFGVQLAMTSRILAKLEYTVNRELGRAPEFPNDIVTSSIVVATD